MFVFDPDYTFEWPVTVKYPSDGDDDICEFTGIFRLPDDEIEVYERGEDVTVQGVILTVRDRLSKYWIGWKDIELAGGGELPFSEDARAKLLKQRPVREGVDRALSEAILGIREKN